MVIILSTQGFSSVYQRNMLRGLKLLHQLNSSFRRNSSTMKAVLVNEFGDPSVLKLSKIDKPAPRNNEALVRVQAAAVNPVDAITREGAFMNLPKLPLILGKEVAGVVEEIGKDVTRVKEGDRVTCCLMRDGGYSEYVACDENHLIDLSTKLSFVEGSALYVAYFTAYRALITKCNVARGELLLVHGASGSVGIAAIQIAKSRGLTVIGTARSKAGREAALKAGADLMFDHSKQGYLADLYAATSAKGFNVILENCADLNLGHDLNILNRNGGRIAVVGTKGSSKLIPGQSRLTEVNPRSLIYTEGAVHGVNLTSISSKEQFEECARAITKGVEEGWIRPIIAQEFKLGQAHEAHRLLGNVPARGKLVLNVVPE